MNIGKFNKPLDENIAIQVEDLTVEFNLSKEKIDTLKDFVI